jgi:hypothetical protein
MEVLTRPKMVSGLKKLGIEVADSSGKMFQLDKIIGNIVGKRKDILKSDLALMQFFKTVGGAEGTVMARRAFVFLARNLTGYQRILRKVTTDNNEFQRSLKTMEDTTGVRWEKFINQLRALALMIGANVLPEILKLAPHVQKLVDYFQNLDPELRAQIVHWAALGVAFIGVASAAMFLLGPLIRMAAALAKKRMLLITVGAGFLAISAAIAVLTGNWNGLNTVIDSFFSLTDQGLGGWVLMFGIATAGALKLSRAIAGVSMAWKSAAIAQAAGTGAAGLGGMAGMFARGKGMGATLKAIPAATAGAGKFRSAMFLVGSAAAAIPGPLKVAGAAITIAAGGALLWSRRQNDIAKAAKETADQLARSRAVAAATGQQAGVFGGLAGAVGDVIKARNMVSELDRQIKAGGTKDQVAAMYIDRARALDTLAAAHRRADTAFNAFNTAIQKQRTAITQLGAVSNRLNMLQRLQALFNRRQAGGASLQLVEQINKLRKALDIPEGFIDQGQIDRRIAETTASYNRYIAGVRTGGTRLQREFRNVVTSLSRMKVLPKLPPNAVQDMFRFALKKGRALTIPEMRAFIKAEIDPKSAPAAMRKFVAQMNKQRAQVKVAAEVKQKQTKLTKDFGKAIGTFTATIKIPSAKKDADAKQKQIAQVFKPTINQKIKVNVVPPNFFNLGYQIASGVGAGIDTGTNQVIIPAVDRMIEQINRAAIAKAQIGSPSKLFERTVGIPIIQGIIKGMLSKKPEISKTAAIIIDLFNGAFLQKKQQRIDSIGDDLQFSQTKLDKYLQQQKDALAKFKKSKKKIDEIRAKEFGEKADKMRLRKGLNFADLLKDARGQVKEFVAFNNALSKLQKRGVPKTLLDNLRDLGVDGLKYIKLLATATPAQLKKYIKAWNQMQGQVRRSQISSIEDLKNWKNQTKEEFNDLVKTAAQNLLDKWNSFREQNASNFGSLFEGPTNLADRIGSAFDDALATYEDSVKDFNQQIADLDKELADATADAFKEIGRLNAEAIAEMARLTSDALKERTDELRGLFGELFAGDWLKSETVTTNAEWGIAASFDDLLKDLTGQLDTFNLWRSTLTSLAARVPPELATALEQLGPEAIAQLTILNGATDEQLAAYIKVWQDSQGAIGAVAQATFETPELTAAIQAVKDTLNTEIGAINADLATRATEIAASIAEIRRQLLELVKPLAITGQDVVNDLNAQIAGWTNWEAVLTQLKNRGVPLQIIQQLREMGPQALPHLQALNSLTDAQLITNPDSWVNTWKKGQALINDSTNVMMNEQLKIWKQYGSDIATAIIAGLATEQEALLKFFSNMFENMLKGKWPQIGTNTGAYGPPDPWMIAAGLAQPESQNAPTAPMSSTYNSTSTGSTINQTVIAHQTESLESTLERANFRLTWRAE